MKFTKNTESGFSLIQLMIVIIIVSIGLVAAARLAQVKFQEDREIEISDSFKNINDLLLAYYTGVDETGTPIKRLPCPARRNLAIGDLNFGTENCTAVQIVSGNVPHPDAAGTNLRVMIGALPVKELSIATEDAFDVFGGQYLYAVSENLTNDSNFLRHDMSAVQRLNDNGTLVGLPLPFIVVSMGDTGRGAYGTNGIILEACPNKTVSREGENCDGDAVFLDAFITERSGDANFYDDRVGFDGTFFAKAGNTLLVNLECPANEFLTGVVNGEAQCTPIVTTSGSGSGGNDCSGVHCGCDNVCVVGVCVQRETSYCR